MMPSLACPWGGSCGKWHHGGQTMCQRVIAQWDRNRTVGQEPRAAGAQ